MGTTLKYQFFFFSESKEWIKKFQYIIREFWPELANLTNFKRTEVINL